MIIKMASKFRVKIYLSILTFYILNLIPNKIRGSLNIKRGSLQLADKVDGDLYMM